MMTLKSIAVIGAGIYLLLGLLFFATAPFGYGYTAEQKKFLKPGAPTATEGLVSWPWTVWRRWKTCRTIFGSCLSDIDEYCARFVNGCDGMTTGPNAIDLWGEGKWWTDSKLDR